MILDSLHNEINLIFNQAHNVCNKNFKGLIAYNGNSFHNLDLGFQTHDGNLNANKIPYTCITYNNQTLYGGFFESVGTTTLFATGMALWNNIKWDTFPKKPFKYKPNKNTTVDAFLKDKGKLWIAGQFDTIAGMKAKCLCTFDGNSYTPINIPVDTVVGIGKMIRYKDGIYMSGFFFDYTPSNNIRIIKYNDDNTWSSVGTGIKGSFDGISDMIVYKDTLYVAGSISKADGNIGNHIMKWDGVQFLDAGFGNFYDWGGINQLLVYKGRLYAFGNFSYAANEKAFGVAYYESGKWVVPKDSLDNGIVGAVVYKDAIYIAGAFKSINADTSLKYFVKLRCPDFNDCKSGNGHPDSESSLFPNPASTEINIHIENDFRYNSIISIYNDIGQLIFSSPIKEYDFKINCSSWAKGLYVINFQNTTKKKSLKVIKE